MSATSTTLRGRAAAERLMVDTVTVTRRTPNATHSDTNPETGAVSPAYATIYVGAAKVQSMSRQTVARPESVGDAEQFLTHREVHLPHSATDVAADDIVTVTASVLDPDLVGKVFHVRNVLVKSYGTSRRLGVIEVGS